MKNTSETKAVPALPGKDVSIKVFGIGGAGVQVLDHLLRGGLPGAAFVAVNSDAQSLAASAAAEKVQLETKLLRGWGTGGDPELGRAVAEAQLPRLKSLCEGVDVIFLLAGLGGGAGTGIAPVLARAAKETGALVLGFVTTPFDCEGGRRQRLAGQGLNELRAGADGVICLPNQRIFKLIDENTTVVETFKITNELLAEGVRGVWRLLAHPGLLEIHFSDLCAVVRDRHAQSAFAVAEAMGPARSREVIEKLLAHPMLDGGQILNESDAVLVSLMSGPELTMAEVNCVMEQIHRHCEQAQVIMGAATDEEFQDRLAVTLIASQKTAEPEAAQPERAAKAEELDTQFLERAGNPRPGSRFVPPPPALPHDKMQQLLDRQGAGSSRRSGKASAKMRQTQLPLEIVAKGRFDKSEPTIHKGEDLDVPTYIRRGVALN